MLTLIADDATHRRPPCRSNGRLINPVKRLKRNLGLTGTIWQIKLHGKRYSGWLQAVQLACNQLAGTAATQARASTGHP